MDGLKISGMDSRISPDVSVSRVGNSDFRSVSKPDASGSDFATTLKDAIKSVDTLQKDSDLKTQQLATGKNTNIHETMIATEKADIALRLMVQVRNKIIEAYQEIMKMQV